MSLQIFLIISLMATVDGSFDRGHNKCSKEWIRFLILSACNYSKRETVILSYFIDNSFEDLHLGYEKSLSVSVSPRFGLFQRKEEETILEKADQNERSVHHDTELAPSGSLLDIYSEDLMRDVEQDGEDWKRQERSIRTLVERCCLKLCQEDDFKGLCNRL